MEDRGLYIEGYFTQRTRAGERLFDENELMWRLGVIRYLEFRRRQQDMLAYVPEADRKGIWFWQASTR